MIAPGFFLAILGLIRIGSTWIWIWILTQNKYPESDYPISVLAGAIDKTILVGLKISLERLLNCLKY
jgi:hypothetical protein